MKITNIINQSRRDFTANIECEGCGNKEELSGGYDDRYYHDEIIPNRKCSKCNKSRNDLNIKGDFTQTKYPAHQIV